MQTYYTNYSRKYQTIYFNQIQQLIIYHIITNIIFKRINTMQLVLDDRIMWWVFLPIVYVTFIMSIIRAFYFKYQSFTTVKKPVNQNGVYQDHVDKNMMSKCDMLHKKHSFISEEAFNSRRSFLCKPEQGYLTKQRDAAEAVDPMAQMQGMMEGMSGTLPTIFISIVTIAWINYSFGGILLAKVPFSLSKQFKTITQSGIQMQNLSVEYISGISFYFLIMFGLAQIYQLFLKEEEDTIQSFGANKKLQKPNPAASASPMGGMNPMMPMNQQQDQNQKLKDLFKAQVQNLSIVQHSFLFENYHKNAVNRLKKFLADQ